MNPDTFRDLLSHWASTVGVVAVRDDGRVHGTTITSFTPVSADPPAVLVSLGPNAQVVPFLTEGARYTVNLLNERQAGIAEVYADPYPVGPSPFPDRGDPVLGGALASMTCEVVEVVATVGGARLVVGRVSACQAGDGRPLLWYRRAPARLDLG